MSKSMVAPSSPLGGSGDMPVEVYGLGGSPRRNAWKGWRLSPVCAWTVGLTIVVVFLCEAIILALMVSLRHAYNTRFAAINEQLTDLAAETRWPQATGEAMHYKCLYLSGGGTVGATGDMPLTKLQHSGKCKPVLDWYFSNAQGQYWQDLVRIGNAAKAYFTGKDTFATDGSDMLVFDIDETVLSNVPRIRANAYMPVKDPSDLKHAPGSKPGDSQASAANSHADDDDQKFSPALDAIRDVYLSAYRYGLSVAFITGRTEGSRDFTERNLKAEGFGEQCPEGKDGKALFAKDTPCYVHLHLRSLKDDMHKLASVYKPERRRQLTDQGYRIVGTFGDQYSDLEGADSATASYKLPNPLYYIL